MCEFCRHISNEIKRLEKRREDFRKERGCEAEERRLKHAHRKEEFAAYYRRNRDRKLAAANARHQRLRELRITQARCVSGDGEQGKG